MSLDIVASPTLSALLDVAGLGAVEALVAQRGGTRVYVPKKVDETTEIAKIIGLLPATAFAEAVGAPRWIDVPNGRGLANARRVSPALVRDLRKAGATIHQIARSVGCTARQVYYILEADDDRQGSLF